MKIRRLTAAAVSAVFCLSLGLGACGDKDGKKDDDGPKSTVATNDDGSVHEELTAIEVTKLMGNGINLGNTMEAYGHNSFTSDEDPSSFEHLWGQPTTTKEMVDGMKAAGFDSLRIPVAWTNAMEFETGDYTINTQYLDRVEEIINYALDNDMYVVVNDHWDGSWWGMFGSASEETRQKAWDMYESMWTQIAERYGKYSDKLIFESANEELGDRLNDTDIAEDSGALSEDECYSTANAINQKFVDIIRSTGGNNANRFLLIAGYNTDIQRTCDDRFQMPTDTAQDKLILSVHYYTPWDYCGVESVTSWGSLIDVQEQNTLFSSLTKFTDQGYGVIIGEYAVAMKAGQVKPDTDKFIGNLLANCDLYGYCPMLWDCSNLYNRRECRMIDDATAQLFLDKRLENEENKTDEMIKADAQAVLDANYEAAEEFNKELQAQAPDENTALAWIMYQSADYGVAYSVGDVFDPTSLTQGLVANNVVIDGEGTYTVSLDMSELNAKGVAFSALGIANGETLYPDYIIDITRIMINGEPYEQAHDEYTNSDDGKCMRVNLYNSWVSTLPDDARTIDGDLSDASPCILDLGSHERIATLEITFDFVKPAA